MTNDETTLVIDIAPDGTAQCIYDDDFADFIRALGNVTITRASHVEPTAKGEWEADMSPVNGPVLGPFKLRGEALDAEREWLLMNVIHCPPSEHHDEYPRDR